MLRILLFALLSTSAHGVTSAPPKAEDLSELLENQKAITSLVDIKKAGLERGSSKIDIWSGSYWPQYQGSVAVRYLDPVIRPLVEAEYKAQWKLHKENFDKNPYYSYTNTDNLSPAEKYDLLVGDPEMSLTTYAWKLGKKNGGEHSGKVPTWRGICDGWASASQKMPRPKRDVILTDPNGKKITFFPEDIKALGSLLYARAQIAPIFLGRRCRIPVAALCGDTNPATLHLALVNRVGQLRKSFIADLSPNDEVWNYPVRSYKLSYYNVLTGDESTDFQQVVEAFDKKKKFRKRESRPENTSFIVGVKATVSFADMRLPYTFEDKLLEHTYNYDLELNSRHEIIGGEAIGKLPDFIWAPKDLTYPLTFVEKTRGTPKTPEELILMSQESSKAGQPLSVIVQRLFELSK